MKRLLPLSLLLASCNSNALPAGLPGDAGVHDGALPNRDGAGPAAALDLASSACSGLAETTCRARPDCHALYRESGLCDCVMPWCCPVFDRCAEGPPVCDAIPTCAQPTPNCGSGQFVVSYRNGCPDGCMQWNDCPDSCHADANCPTGDFCCPSRPGSNRRTCTMNCVR